MVDTRPFDYLFKVRERAERGDNTHARIVFLSFYALSLTPLPPLHTNQILLVGDSGVGKSSLLLRFTSGEFEEASVPTIGKQRERRSARAGGGRWTKNPPSSTSHHFPFLHTHTYNAQASTSGSSSWSSRASA